MGIGTILIERGLISEDQLDEAIREQKRTGERLDHVLVRLEHVAQDVVLEAIGRQLDMAIVDLAEIDVDDETLRTLPSRLVFKKLCVPISRTETTLQIACWPLLRELWLVKHHDTTPRSTIERHAHHEL